MTLAERIQQTLNRDWLSLSELVELTNEERTNSTYSATSRAAEKLLKAGAVEKKKIERKTHYRLSEPSVRREQALWIQPVNTWWNESCGDFPYLFNKLAPLPDPATGKRGPATKLQCLWSCRWANGQLPNGDNFYLAEVDANPVLRFYEARDYLTLKINTDELIPFVLHADVNNLGAEWKDGGPACTALGRARARRIERTSPWNFEEGRYMSFGMTIAASWRPHGWSPVSRERGLIGRFPIQTVSIMNWDSIVRLHQETLKSPSILLDYYHLRQQAGTPVSIFDLLKNSDAEIKVMHDALLEARSL